MGFELSVASGGSGGALVVTKSLANGTYHYHAGRGGLGQALYTDSITEVGSFHRAGDGEGSSFGEIVTAGGGGGGISNWRDVSAGSPGLPNGSRGSGVVKIGSNEIFRDISITQHSISGPDGAGAGGSASFTGCGEIATATNGESGHVYVRYIGPLQSTSDIAT